MGTAVIGFRERRLVLTRAAQRRVNSKFHCTQPLHSQHYLRHGVLGMKLEALATGNWGFWPPGEGGSLGGRVKHTASVFLQRPAVQWLTTILPAVSCRFQRSHPELISWLFADSAAFHALFAGFTTEKPQKQHSK